MKEHMTENEKSTETKNNTHSGLPGLSKTTTLTGVLSAAPKLETGYLTASKKIK